MLSVQSAGCAGMERLGVPARTSLNTPPDDRGHISRRMRVDTIQTRELLVHDTTLLSDRQIRNNNHLHHYHRVGCGSNSSSYSICNSSNIRVEIDAATIMTAQRQQQAVAAKLKPINNDNHHHQQQQQQAQHQQQQQIRCPHHVPLPDSEWGQDRDLQIRTRYQQSEITRSYIKPPPNKTVLDVPEQSYNIYSSTGLSTTAASATSGISCNLRANLTNQHSNNHHNYNLQQPCTSGSHQSAILSQQQQKSKPNVITKLFSRKSSPKSPTALCSSSSISSNSSLSSSASSSSSPSTSSSPSSSSVSTSSSSSSLCSAQTLPISTAATLTATTCSLGAAAPIQQNPTPTCNNSVTSSSSSSSFLTTIAAARCSPSPPLTVTVPVGPNCANGTQQFHLQQHLVVDSTNSSNLSSTSSLHLLKSSSCNLSPGTMDTAQQPSTSIDCCYAQATSSNLQRSHSTSSHTAPNSPTSTISQQQQQSIDNCGNSNSSSTSSISSNNSMSSSRNYQHHI